MKKCFSLILLISIPIATSADTNDTSKRALPLTGSGIQVIPLSEMNIPEDEKKKMLSRLKMQKENGYIEDNSNEPNELLHTGQMFLMGEKKADQQNSDPHDTRMKKNLSQIKLAFPFKGVPTIEPENIIGFSAQGMWKNGWTGVREVFNKKNLRTCEFNLFNLSLSQGGEVVAAEFVNYDINHKPTTTSVSGSKDSGFLYSIGWADDQYSYELTCANKSFDLQLKHHLIKLARDIDQSNSSSGQENEGRGAQFIQK